MTCNSSTNDILCCSIALNIETYNSKRKHRSNNYKMHMFHYEVSKHLYSFRLLYYIKVCVLISLTFKLYYIKYIKQDHYDFNALSRTEWIIEVINTLSFRTV